jgi:hypothetical protein
MPEWAVLLAKEVNASVIRSALRLRSHKSACDNNQRDYVVQLVNIELTTEQGSIGLSPLAFDRG